MNLFAAISLLVFTLACGGPNDRQEDITKIRGLGLTISPLVSTPSTAGHPKTVDLTVTVAVPNGEAVRFEKYIDQPTTTALLLDTAQYDLVADSQAVEAHKGFSIVTMRATANVPNTESLAAIGGQVRVGFRITGKSNAELVIGNFLVVPPSETSLLAWKQPTVDIQMPSTGTVLQSGATIQVVANPTNYNGEDLIVGWFVGGGEITNRRAINTYWQTPGAGSNTLVVTIRGEKSLGFAMKVLDFTIQ